MCAESCHDVTGEAASALSAKHFDARIRKIQQLPTSDAGKQLENQLPGLGLTRFGTAYEPSVGRKGYIKRNVFPCMSAENGAVSYLVRSGYDRWRTVDRGHGIGCSVTTQETL